MPLRPDGLYYVQAPAKNSGTRLSFAFSTVRLRGRHPPQGGCPPTERGL